MLKKWLFNPEVRVKSTLAVIFVVANPLIWYYTVNVMLQEAIAKMSQDPNIAIIIWGVHFLGIIISAIVGAVFFKRIDQNRFLSIWMLLGVASSLSIFFIYSGNLFILSLISLFLGISLGVGMPACMGYFTNSIPIEKRGRVSGCIFLFFTIGFALMLLVPYDAFVVGIILAAFRLSSLFVFNVSQSQKKVEIHKESLTSYKAILKERSFILYFIPWVMFCFANYLTPPIQSSLLGDNRL